MAEEPEDPADPALLLGGTRAQAMQRLQIGVFGLATMILLIGLAQIIMNQAREAEAGVVPEAAPTVARSETPAAESDPLADAGVAPEVPAEPEAEAPPISDALQGD
jgi:hypothetical protein